MKMRGRLQRRTKNRPDSPGVSLAEVGHETIGKASNPFGISSGNGLVSTTFRAEVEALG